MNGCRMLAKEKSQSIDILENVPTIVELNNSNGECSCGKNDEMGESNVKLDSAAGHAIVLKVAASHRKLYWLGGTTC